MQQRSFIILGVIILIVAGVWLLDSQSNNQPEELATDTSAPPPVEVVEEETVTADTEQIEPEIESESIATPAPTTESEVLAAPEPHEQTAGTFTAYSPAALAAAADDRVVLFFKASWCPSCRALEANIQENLSIIPGDVTILTVDFDTATDLKVKYGILNRHTMVYIDANGNEIKKWSGSPRLENLLAEI